MSPPTADRKRKHSTQTISDLFTAQQKPLASHDLPASPSTKRSRLEKALSGAASPSSPITLENMYDFPRTSKRTDVVDLTQADKPARRNGTVRRPNINPHGGAKRLVVKNFKTVKPFDTKKYLEEQWVKLDKALDIVFDTAGYNFSLEDHYRAVENLCRQNHGEELMRRLKRRCKDYIGGPMKEKLEEKVVAENVDVLRVALRAWARWTEQYKILQWVFCYLDRAYLLPKHTTLEEICIDLFRTVIFGDQQLNPKIVGGACDLIATHRTTGADFDRETLADAIKMFHATQTYTSTFEPKFLEQSQIYILYWAETTVANTNLAEYVEQAVDLIQSELHRVDTFALDTSTRRELLTQLETHLVSRRQTELLNQNALSELLESNAVDDLKKLYELLERRGLGAKLRPAFEKWIENTGTAIVFNEKEQDDMVVKLLCLKQQLDAIWKASFHRNEEIGHGLREAFEAFINKTKKTSSTWNTDNSKPGEMIAKYVDMLLRGGARAIPAQLSAVAKKTAADDEDNEDAIIDEDTEINLQLDQVLDLFRFVHGKAVFEAFYKRDLARRLLMGRSASADAERSMLSRLKTECGAGFTANLEQMFKDIELAREEMASYRSILDERRERQPFDLGVMVLSASAWPTYADVKVIIPPEIKQAIDKFEVYYKSKHSGRKLDWKHTLATCQLKANFPKGKKELVVSSFQAIILLLFNGLDDTEKLSYDYISQATGLPRAELARTLQSLACAKVRPLTKHPKGRDINPTDTFSLNTNFSDPKYRIKVNTVQLKETKEENKATHERIAEDRNYETQAAIVRILKSRKKIGHSELVAETIRVTKNRGTLDVAGIKRNIDRLIEKEFLEREDDGGYSYVA